MRALILCCGEARRWTGPARKQLCMVDDEPLLDRTIRQFSGRGCACTVVSNDGVFRREGANFFQPGETRWLVETVLKTEQMWEGQTILVLGDVVFTEFAVDEICSARGLHWFGRPKKSPITGGDSEIFAIAVDEPNYERLAKAMWVGFEDAEDSGEEYDSELCPYGSVWQPYRYLEGQPLKRHAIVRGPDAIWRDINDFTDDFDSYNHYRAWTARWKRRFIRQGPPPSIDKLEAPVVEV